jgi:hypothetical protein
VGNAEFVISKFAVHLGFRTNLPFAVRYGVTEVQGSSAACFAFLPHLVLDVS